MSDHPEQVTATLNALRDVFRQSLVAVYLHGSAAAAGLRPGSDLDLLAVIGRPMEAAERAALLASLLRISARHPAAPGGPRCVEVMVFDGTELRAPGFPARAQFVYGEWRRPAFEAGEVPLPAADAEHTLVLAQARREARALRGPPAAELLPEIPLEQVRQAMAAALPVLLDGLYGDERNVLLTLARMWRTAATGEFVAKDAAAVWAGTRMPEREAATLDLARRGYLGEAEGAWSAREPDARRAAAYLRGQVTALL